MKLTHKMLAISAIILNSAIVFAAPPDIQYNVNVLSNATAAQCIAAARGDVDPISEQIYTTAGEYDGSSGAGVRSCTGCKVDYKTKNCICSTCYSYFN